MANLVGVFEHFKKNDEFFCFSGQSNQAVTGMFNLCRASQVLFQGEKILEDAKNYSAKFLTKNRELPMDHNQTFIWRGAFQLTYMLKK